MMSLKRQTNHPDDVTEGNSSKLDLFDGAFDAASIINLDSGKLTDVLADKDFVSIEVSPKNTLVLPLAPANESTQEGVLTDEDWTM